jgi:hypothetical protein
MMGISDVPVGLFKKNPYLNILKMKIPSFLLMVRLPAVDPADPVYLLQK